MNHKKKYVILSYDWRDLFKTDPAAVRAKLLRDHLNPENHKFFFVSWSSNSYVLRLDTQLATVHKKARFHSLRPIYDFLLSWQLEKILKKNNFDPEGIIVYDLGMVYAAKKYAKKYNIPIILFITNLPDTLLKTRRFSWSRLAYQKFLEYLNAASISRALVISDATKNYAQKIGIREDIIIKFAPDTITPYLDTIDQIKLGTIRDKYNISPTKHILLSVGRLEPEKGFDRLLKVFAEIKHDDLKLIIVGDGILRDDLRMQTKVLGIEDDVIFAGSIPHKELWAYYADCAIFVLFSRSEALGLVVWEAMYMNKPVIATRAEGIIESIGMNNERGFLWEEKDGAETFRGFIDTCLNEKEGDSKKITLAKEYVINQLMQYKKQTDL